MDVRYLHGVRIERLTFDPVHRVRAALWSHRVARRAGVDKAVASEPLASTWTNVLGLPFHHGVVAFGVRLELLPSGYGVGGAATLMTLDGVRALVVGPTTSELEPRQADQLVLYAAAAVTPESDWLSEVAAADGPQRIAAPDAAAAARIARALDDAGLPWSGPTWLTTQRRAALQLVVGAGRAGDRVVDARPQAGDDWLVEYAGQVEAELIHVHGPRAESLASALAAAGLSARVLHVPQQLALSGLESSAAPEIR